MSDASILELGALEKHFAIRNDFGWRTGWLRALDGVSLAVRRGEILGVVVLKLVALPIVAGGLAWALGLHGVTAQTVVVLAALPCVAPRFSLGASLGTAPPILNAAATATTLLWVVTLPFALWILT